MVYDENHFEFGNFKIIYLVISSNEKSIKKLGFKWPITTFPSIFIIGRSIF